MSGPAQPQTIHGVINRNFANLRGKLLTIVETTFPEGQRCNALKSVVRRELGETQSRLNAEVKFFLEESSRESIQGTDRR